MRIYLNEKPGAVVFFNIFLRKNKRFIMKERKNFSNSIRGVFILLPMFVYLGEVVRKLFEYYHVVILNGVKNLNISALNLQILRYT